MKYSGLFPKTRRHLPKGVVAKSYQLLFRAGYIRPLGKGLFVFLPLGLRVVRKVEALIRAELDALGGQEVELPMVNPLDLWRKSGREELTRSDMVSFADRFGREHVLATTNEEAMVEMVRSGLNGYRDLPVFLYQFQEKYRDEERTRGGLIRANEFLMSDAYSFHRSFSDLNNFFPKIFRAYERVFARCNVPAKAAEAGVGYMGGEKSYEFLYPSANGDDYVLECTNCGYTANRDVAVAAHPSGRENPAPLERIRTPECTTMKRLAAHLECSLACLAKSMMYVCGNELVMAVVRADFEVSVEKLGRVLGAPVLRMATKEELDEAGLNAAYLSPLGSDGATRIVVDRSVVETPNLVCATNETGIHARNVNFGRDFDADATGDIALIHKTSLCLHCGNELSSYRALELGHIFRLGDFYTRRMNLGVRDERGRWFNPQMGSYGIGIGRLVSAIVEANHDDGGIVWPVDVAPFRCYLMTIGKSRSVRDAGDALAAYLEDDVLYDDRDESIGTKFKDFLLLGIPFRIIISPATMSDGTVEIFDRRTAETRVIDADAIGEYIEELSRMDLSNPEQEDAV